MDAWVPVNCKYDVWHVTFSANTRPARGGWYSEAASTAVAVATTGWPGVTGEGPPTGTVAESGTAAPAAAVAGAGERWSVAAAGDGVGTAAGGTTAAAAEAEGGATACSVVEGCCRPYAAQNSATLAFDNVQSSPSGNRTVAASAAVASAAAVPTAAFKRTRPPGPPACSACALSHV